MLDARHKCPIQEELKRSRDRRKTLGASFPAGRVAG